ncbi:MAG: 2,3-bisphosphoglycerate-independent phosphoglycerate mutase [Flavobacteriales bacterium]
MKRKVGLIILDGWGHGEKVDSNAVFKANTPFIDSLYEQVPNAELRTDGEFVGLPEGQMGNSEVGHMNIGAGRVVYQDLVKINKSISSEEFYELDVLKNTFRYAKENDKPVHLMGLVSDGGVHSSLEHVKALCTMAHKENFDQLYIHAFTDGRDTDPDSGKEFLAELEAHCNATKGTIVSVIGRYYAMDRDKRWERVQKAYDLMLSCGGEKYASVAECLDKNYAKNITDEFIEAAVIGNGEGRINEGDTVICFNFRTDRCREITQALTQQAFPEFGMKPLNLHYVTMTKYDPTYKNVHVVFEKDNLENTLGEVISKAGLTQVRIAETEKYPHVTFFFSGGREQEFTGETRLMASSPKVSTYDLQPEMSASDVSSKIMAEIEANEPNYFCLNFANPDMVGHTGVFDAIVKAVEATDGEAKKVCELALSKGYALIIIADHGNAEKTQNSDGSVHTAHTTNPVPVFLLGTDYDEIRDGKLADVAPTVLELLEVPQPSEMTGKSIIKK